MNESQSESVYQTAGRIDRQVREFLSEWSLRMLRVSLAVTYIWFGALKLFGASPVSPLVKKMSFVLPGGFFVKLMGVWEVALGMAFLFRIALRPTLFLYVLQLFGTFMVFIVQPKETYEKGNPLRLTYTGEFIVKNLVLLMAGLVVGSTVERPTEEITPVPASSTEETRKEVEAA